MPLAKALDIESVRFSAPDLGRMHAFLSDFGLRDAEECGDGVLRMRGTGDAPAIHETIEGEPGFVGLSMRVRDMADLEALASAEKVSIENASGPGGGHMVRLTDPDGFRVTAIAGKARRTRTLMGCADLGTLRRDASARAPPSEWLPGLQTSSGSGMSS